jgi:hypothetical protein
MPTFEDLEDEWAWNFEEKEQLTVKSTYRLKRQINDVAGGG